MFFHHCSEEGLTVNLSKNKHVIVGMLAVLVGRRVGAACVQHCYRHYSCPESQSITEAALVNIQISVAIVL